MPDERAHLPTRRGSDRWARAIAITLAVNTGLVAGLTWMAVARASAARDEDRRAVLETVQTELVRVGAQVQARDERSNAAAYLATRAQARAVAGLGASFARSGDVVAGNAYTDEAEVLAAAADSSAPLAFDQRFLRPGGYDAEGRQQALVRNQAATTVPPEVPDQTVRGADRRHAQAELLARLVAVLVGVILVLTLARIAHGKARLRLLAAGWCVMAAVVLAAALIGG
jgi:hypothetical protein